MHPTALCSALLMTALCTATAPVASAQEDAAGKQDGAPEVGSTRPEDGPQVPRHSRLRFQAPQDGGLFSLDDLQMAMPRGPRLGVTVEDTADGVLVKEVEADSLAAAAGVQAGDVVLRIGDERVQGVGDVRRLLSSYAPGEDVALAVIRPQAGIVELHAPLPKPEHDGPPVADGFEGGFLGVVLGEEREGGVSVDQVVDGSAAWHAGLQSGDLLCTIDGREVQSPADVVGAVSSHEPGSFVELSYERDGTTHTARARLAARQPLGMLGLEGSLPGMRSGPRAFALPFEGGELDVEPFLHQLQPRPRNGMRMHLRGLDGSDGHDLLWKQLEEQEDGATRVFRFQPDGRAPAEVHEMRIEVKDGVMAVTKDGETTTYSLDGDGTTVIEMGTTTEGGAADLTELPTEDI